MKMLEIARRLGKHDNTIRNWAEWYAEYLSPAPAKGEVRRFTDADLRVLSFVNELSERGINRTGIEEALRQKNEAGTPFPPLHPSLLSNDGRSETGLSLQEAKEQLAVKDSQISELTATVEELRRQIGVQQTMAEKEREESQKRYDALVQKYIDDLSRLNYEKGRLEEQLKSKDHE